MDRSNPYFKQVALLVKILPILNEVPDFAMKGGTAINLFYRDMPRLSVDIDLVYVPIKDRKISLEEMTAGFRIISDRIKRHFPKVEVQYSILHKTKYVTRLLIKAERAVVKIEASPVLRGTVYTPHKKRICAIAEDSVGFAEVPIVSFEDLYAGKILAALDRQHPRDLFDIKGLLENEGVTGRFKEAFMVYLISHNRRSLEIFNPSLLDIEQVFRTDFSGMTTNPVTIEELTNARYDLIKAINSLFDYRDKRFLLDFKKGQPDWTYFNFPHIKDLPAVKWKQHNLNQMSKDERQKMVLALEDFFGMS